MVKLMQVSPFATTLVVARRAQLGAQGERSFVGHSEERLSIESRV
jgi:hypothetical protein